MLRPDPLLALLRQRVYDRAFAGEDRSSTASVMTKRVTVHFPFPDFHRRDTQHYGLRQEKTEKTESADGDSSCGMRLAKSPFGERCPSWESTFLTRFKASVP